MDVTPATIIKLIIAVSILTIDYTLHLTMKRYIGGIAKRSNFLTSSNCSHLKGIHSSIWCQA